MTDTIVLIGAVISILIGLILAYKGFDLMKGFVRSTGAVVGGIVFFLIGGIVGVFFGPIIAIIASIAMGIIGVIIGYFLAPTLLWLMLSIIVFIICFNVGANAAENLGASDILVWTAAIIAGLVGSWTFSFLARKLLVGATSVVGGLLVGSGVFLILLDYLDFPFAAGIGAGTLVLVAVTGYGANRGKGKSRKRK